MPNLFPVFDVPEIKEEKPTIKYNRSAYFDFNKGDFVRDGSNKIVSCDGKEAWRQWCIKTVLTERFVYSAYSNNEGVELEQALQWSDIKAVESSIEKTVTEALMADPMGRTQFVRDFQFNWLGDHIYTQFVVQGIEAEAEVIGVNLKMK